MTGEAPPPAPPPEIAPDPDSGRRERLRARIRAFQVLLALGVLSALAGAIITGSLFFALRPELESLPPVLRDVVLLALMRLWVWAVAPLAAWGAGRVLSLRPWATAFSICAWGETMYVAFDLAIHGFVDGVYRSLPFFSARVVTLALGMALGWRLAKRGRAAAERVKARHEAEAEATRARYARWLEEQTRQRS